MTFPIKSIDLPEAVKKLGSRNTYPVTISLLALAMCCYLVNVLLTQVATDRAAFLTALSAETAAITKLATDVAKLSKDVEEVKHRLPSIKPSPRSTE